MSDQETVEKAAEAPSREISRVDAPYDPRGIENVIAGHRGLVFPNLPALVEGSKLMARAGIAIPPHCRDEPGVCFAILLHCENWQIKNPIFIANHSYVVTQNKKYKDENGRDAWDTVETLAFDATVFHAVVAASGLVQPTPEYEYSGEGPTRTCTASFTLLKNGKVVSYTTPQFQEIKTKNSPLWLSNPDMQLGYYAVRNLARAYFPLALGGIYDKDEYDESIATTQFSSSPKLIERLSGKAGALEPEKVTEALAIHTNEAEKPKGKHRKKGGPTSETTDKVEPPKTASQYSIHAENWIERAASGDEADKQWEDEGALREKVGVPVKERLRLRNAIDVKFGAGSNP
jgi:hypothetical protein